MFTCNNCQARFTDPRNFCGKCGAALTVQPQVIASHAGFTSVSNSHRAAAHGFGRVFGLHPGVAFFTIAVNLMLFGKDGLALVFVAPTAGADIPVALFASALAGAAVGYISYLGQKKWDGDDGESAKIKGLITGVLTAIPTGLPGMLFGSAALVGMLRRKKR